ncbi:MAG: hypothetical protein Q9199_004488 [Rusavskia elegans]
MAPKPFPFPIGVGVDICHLKRLSFILSKQDDYVTRWAKKVFTRQEWPSLWQSFNRAIASSSNASESPKPQLSLPKFRITRPGKQKPDVHGTPVESSINVLGSPSPVHELPPPTPSMSEHKWRVLAQHLAGRWAAKEATIKASRQRKLLLKDISIVQCNSHGRVHALIAPEHATDIVMSPEVATKRGLSEAQSPGAGTLGQVVNGLFVSNTQTASRHELDSRFFLRKAKIRDEEQQIAEISISHDNEYAVAVCMSLAEDSHSRDRPQCIIDDGLGEPLHEPEWGDSGYLEGGNLSSTGNN